MICVPTCVSHAKLLGNRIPRNAGDFNIQLRTFYARICTVINSEVKRLCRHPNIWKTLEPTRCHWQVTL